MHLRVRAFLSTPPEPSSKWRKRSLQSEASANVVPSQNHFVFSDLAVVKIVGRSGGGLMMNIRAAQGLIS